MFLCRYWSGGFSFPVIRVEGPIRSAVRNPILLPEYVSCRTRGRCPILGQTPSGRSGRHSLCYRQRFLARINVNSKCSPAATGRSYRFLSSHGEPIRSGKNSTRRHARVAGPSATLPADGRLHLRDLFRDDPQPGRPHVDRGLRPVAGLLEEPRHGRDDAAAPGPGRSGRIWPRPSSGCSPARRSTSPRIAPCCTWPCATVGTQPVFVDGQDVMPDVSAVLDQMAAFAEQGPLRASGPGTPASRSATSSTSASAARTWGPAMACEALRPYSDRQLTVRFVSNVDGTHLAEATRDLDPAETLFIVACKTFTTQETMTNARSARELAPGARWATRRPWPGISWPCRPTTKAVGEFGIDAERTCSSSGTGSAGATACRRPSGCR